MIGSPYLHLGLAAALFCAALLAFNVANEYVALKGEIPWPRLPTIQSFLGAPYCAESERWSGIFIYMSLRLSNCGVSVP